jgi:gamma-glutamyltranspeptidase/glutathione hydrolase
VTDTYAPFATRYAPHAMVSTIDHLATEAGLGVLRDGGGAVDAAIAANAVLSVTAPNLCGMGGDLFALIAHDGAPVLALNASGRAGSGADPERLRAEGNAEMPFRGDIRSVTVPGCVDGWVALHERFGRLPLARLLAPAASYAREGFPASPLLAVGVAALPKAPETQELRGPTGRRRPGDIVRRPGVARTLEAIATSGRAGFYGGEFGEGLLALGEGEYSEADLERTGADWVDAISATAFGHHVWTMPPNSQGYVLAASAWIANGLDLPATPEDPLWAHLLVEASKQAGFDRPQTLHEHADGRALLAPSRLDARRRAIDPAAASGLAGPVAQGDTTALCVIDGAGVGVSLIQSNASGFGSHLFEPRTGINLHNRGLGFSLEPGHPAEYGPGRRPPHTLTPAVVTDRDGRLVATLATMGGDSQPQVLLQVLARVFAAGETPGRAIAAGRFRLVARERTTGFAIWTDPAGTAVAVEGHAPEQWRDGLRSRGHPVVTEPPFDHGFGHAHLIVRADDRLAGAGDPRPRIGLCSGI